jgi:hypothetical protein
MVNMAKHQPIILTVMYETNVICQGKRSINKAAHNFTRVELVGCMQIGMISLNTPTTYFATKIHYSSSLTSKQIHQPVISINISLQELCGE